MDGAESLSTRACSRQRRISFSNIALDHPGGHIAEPIQLFESWLSELLLEDPLCDAIHCFGCEWVAQERMRLTRFVH